MAKQRRESPLRALVTALVIGATGVGIAGIITLQSGDEASDLQATPATVWLSGEQRGRVVLATSGSDLASLGVALNEQATELDVVDVGETVFVHDRAKGEVLVMSGVDGQVANRFPAPGDTGGRSVLTRSGSSAYLYNSQSGTVHHISESGTKGAVLQVGAMTSWVGTSDGQLWMLDTPGGKLTRVEGDEFSTFRVAQPNANIELSSVGTEPVIIERATNRLRWPRHNSTTETSVALLDAVVQQPGGHGSCLAVAAGTKLACYDSRKETRSLTLAQSVASGSVLLSNNRNAAFLRPGAASVLMATWATGASSTADRPSPSTRIPRAWTNPGPLLIDDPGSGYAVTVSGGKLTPLDKFSRRTFLYNDGTIGTEGDIGTSVTSGNAGDPGTRVLSRTVDTGVVPIDDGRNEPPVATPDRAVTRPGRSVRVAVLANDRDPDGDLLAVSSAGPAPADSGVVNVVDGQWVNYAAPAGFSGQVTFPYVATDPGNLRANSTVTVTIVGPETNTNPVATDDADSTLAAAPILVEVLVNDFDAEGDNLTVSGVTNPAHGTATATGDGRVRYDPNPGFAGEDAFGYTVTDGFGGRATAQVRITVTAQSGTNRAPTAVDDRATATASKRQSIGVLANDTDPENDALRIVEVSDVPGVILTIVGGQSIDFTADAATNGPVSFTYTIADTAGLRATAKVLVVVEAPNVNRPPQAIDDQVVTATDKTINVLANDLDPDRDPLSLTSVGTPTFGTAIRVSPLSVRYVPPAGFIGSDVFTYVVSDPSGLVSIGRVFVEVVRVAGANPIAHNDSANVFPGESVVLNPLANDTHPDGLPISLAGSPTARSGQLVVNADQTLTFTPDSPALAVHLITYTIADSVGRTSTGQIAIAVVARPIVNKAPTAADDQVDTDHATTVTIRPLGNDSDPDGSAVELVSVSSPTNGTARVQGSTIVFTPSSNFDGLATMTYVIRDPEGLQATARIIVGVAPRPRIAPLATSDNIVSVGGTVVSLDPLNNDTDPDGVNTDLQLRNVSGPIPTSVNGRLLTISPPSQPGQYSVSYVVVDADGLTATGRVFVSVVDPPNRPPIAGNDSASTPFNTSVVISVLNNDRDPDGGPLRVAAVSTVSPSGTAEVVGGGIRFTPSPGFSGTATFSYTLEDDQQASVLGFVTVRVDSCSAQAPSLRNDQAFTGRGTPVEINVFSNDTGTGGTFAVTTPSSGSVTVLSPGRVVFTPDATSSTSAFSYSVQNGCGVIATATVSITVNRPPSANNSAAEARVGESAAIQLSALSADPDGDALTYVVSNPVGGTIVVNQASGRAEFSATVVGIGGFSFTVRDSGGLTASANVVVTVSPPLVLNSPPVAVNDVAQASLGSPLRLNVLGNDSDPDDPISMLRIVSSQAGEVTPNRRFIDLASPATPGVVRFTYTIEDPAGARATAEVQVTYVDVNQLPIARDDSGSASVGIASNVSVLDNDTDPDGTVTELLVTGATLVSGEGVLTFTANAVSFTASSTLPVTIRYSIRDANGGTAQALITLSVTPVQATTTTQATSTTQRTTSTSTSTTTPPESTTSTVTSP